MNEFRSELGDSRGTTGPRARTRHERQLATMVEVARKLTSQLDLPAVLDAVAEAAADVFGGEVGFRLLEGDELVRYRATPGAREAMGRERLKIGESIPGRVAATGEPIITADTAVDEQVILEYRQASRPESTRAVMCVPIRGGARLLGTLNIYRERGHQFDGAALDLAMSLAAQAGVALENARLYEEATRRRREVETLARIGVSLTESLDVATASQQIVDSVHELLGTKTSTLRLLESDGSLPVLAFGGPLRDMLPPGHVLPAGISVGGQVIATGQPAWSRDVLTDPRITLDDTLREALEQAGVGSLLAVPLRVRGRVIGVLAVGDVAGRGYSEAEIALLQMFADQAAVAFENARLYREALEAYRQLSETQGHLLHAQKMEAVGRLAGGVAHDFNNMLTVIVGRSEVLLHRLPAADRSRRDVETIAATAARASALTRQLLAFSRRQTLQATVVAMNEVVSGLHAMLRQLIGEDIVLEAELGAEAGWVLADRGQLEQVVTNLVINARDAMPSGGRVVIATGRAVLDAAFVRANPGAGAGEHVFCRIADTGTGMDPETQVKIFEPFFTTRGPGQGTGLGLSTVEGIVKQHGGCITVQSVLGHGSTFTVYLPRAEPTPTLEHDADVGREPEHGGHETILVVEDEEAVRELASEILEAGGFTVLRAANGREALELWREHGTTIDLVLTDVVMPGMSGLELAEELQGARRDIKIVYMSGYPAHPSGQRLLVSTGTPVLEKPFTARALTEMVRRTLDTP